MCVSSFVNMYIMSLCTCDLNTGLQICRHSPDREVAIMIVMAYLSYMMAEVRYICFEFLYVVMLVTNKLPHINGSFSYSIFFV